jgi:hypothetical protein
MSRALLQPSNLLAAKRNSKDESINQSIKPWLIQLLPNQSQTTSKEHSELIRAAEKQELIVDLDQKISREGAAGTLSFETRYVHNTII